jgi:hypothetical protein
MPLLVYLFVGYHLSHFRNKKAQGQNKPGPSPRLFASPNSVATNGHVLHAESRLNTLLAAIRRASSRVSNLAADCRPDFRRFPPVS